MLVIAWQDRMGNVYARPVSDRAARKFARRVAKNGGPSFATQERDGFTAFFQEGMGAAEFLDDCTPAQRRDIENGYTVRFRADPWIVGHWYGYDAHTVAE